MDWFEFDDIEAVATKPRDRELVPEGTHTFTIERSSSDDRRFEVALAHEDRRLSWVWAKLPKDTEWGQRLIVGLAKSLGYEAAPWKAAKPEDLVGRKVIARVYHKPGNAGGVFVNVGEFAPVEAEQLVAKAAHPAARARTADQKFKAETRGGGDDIPF